MQHVYVASWANMPDAEFIKEEEGWSDHTLAEVLEYEASPQLAEVGLALTEAWVESLKRKAFDEYLDAYESRTLEPAEEAADDFEWQTDGWVEPKGDADLGHQRWKCYRRDAADEAVILLVVQRRPVS